MSFFRFQFLSTQFLAVMLTVIAYDKRYFQESIGNGRKVNLENSILQHYDGQKPELKPLFIKKLNEIQSLAELSRLVMRSDRRFCADTTLRILEGLNSAETRSSNITRLQESMSKLKNYCAKIKRGRATAVPGLTVHEITKMNAARLGAKKVACKPRATLTELPPAAFGSTYYPQCVTVKRCGGCCNSALLECKPVNITIVTKWVMKFVLSRNKYERTQSFSMEQHVKCECGCKTTASHCSKAQVYDEDSCQCKCINEADSSSCGNLKKWDPTKCSCICKQSLLCSTGAYIHPVSCKCISNKTMRNQDMGRDSE